MKKPPRDLFGGRGQAAVFNDQALRWWRDARFGLFIHWGLYAIPAGVWEGEPVEGIGEWIMRTRRMPRDEYAGLASRFNPASFDARQWVGYARAAGMKYLVITTKHHDGFAMWNSQCSPYNVVRATPWGRDPVRELAEACREADIKIGFYYSQDQDWHDPDGAWNDWDFDPAAKDFRAYLDRKVKPQLKELLTQYGPVGLVWFDTPYTISAEHSRELADYVRSLQPDCLVSGRIGHDLGDYGSLGDNQIPAGRVTGDYETPATMNDTWGYKSADHNWKSVDILLRCLIDLAGKGINYLLNVGPTAEGLFPAESVTRLAEIGAWLNINGEAIHGTRANPFPLDHAWGRITHRSGRMYLMLFDWPVERFVLYGLHTTVRRATLLEDPERVIQCRQTRTGQVRHDVLELTGLGPRPKLAYGVIALDLDGDIAVDDSLMQQPDGSLRLPAQLARIHGNPQGKMGITPSGFTAGWTRKAAWLSWSCRIFEGGTFSAELISARPHHELPSSGIDHRLCLEAGRRQRKAGGFDGTGSAARISIEATLKDDGSVDEPRTCHFPERITRLGTIILPAAGVYFIRLKISDFAAGDEHSVSISELQLRRI